MKFLSFSYQKTIKNYKNTLREFVKKCRIFVSEEGVEKRHTLPVWSKNEIMANWFIEVTIMPFLFYFLLIGFK